MKEQAFIVFDGIDGDGKTTQALLLKEYIRSKGKEVFLTSEPTESEYGKQAESLLRKKQASQVSREKWLELFTLDRKENVKKLRAALEEGKIVICDRYYYSTLAYHLEEQEWQQYSQQFPAPTITFILDCDVDIALTRIKEKYALTGEKKAYFEKKEILRKTRKKFLLIPNYLKDNIKIVDSSKQIKEIFEEIKKEIENLLCL